jgi:hypothetical protein
MLDLQHQYNNCIITPHMRVGPSCCTVVVLVLYKNQIPYIYKENVRFTIPIQQLYNNPSHEGGSHILGSTLM